MGSGIWIVFHEARNFLKGSLVVIFGTDWPDVHCSLHFHGFRIDSVVLGMSADELDVDDAELIGDSDNQAVVVALDIKDDASVLQDACIAVVSFDIGRLGPICL